MKRTSAWPPLRGRRLLLFVCVCVTDVNHDSKDGINFFSFRMNQQTVPPESSVLPQCGCIVFFKRKLD